MFFWQEDEIIASSIRAAELRAGLMLIYSRFSVTAL
jgi:hypothetical protein